MAADVTLRRIGFLLGYDIDERSEQKVESSINGLKNMARTALGAIGIGLSLHGIKNAITQCVSLSSEFEEMENKFNVVFGEMKDEVDEWAKNYSDAIGRNKNDIKQYLADNQNLFVGFGATREQAAELSQNMVTLGMDIASFANLNETESINAFSKALMGETECAKRLGAVLNETTRADAMQTLGMAGKYEALTQLQKMEVNYQAILSQSADAVGDCERSMSSYATAMKQFQGKLKEIKQLVGQFFMPTARKILQLGTMGLVKIRDIVDNINDFSDSIGEAERIIAVFGGTAAASLGTLFAMTNGSQIAGAIANVLKYGKAIGMIGLKALPVVAIILLLALAIDDFVSFMRGGDSVIGRFFDAIGIGSENGRKAIIDGWNKITTFLKDVWNGIKTLASQAFGKISAWWEENGGKIVSSLSKIWDGIKRIWDIKMKLIKKVVEAVFSGLKKFWNKWGASITEYFSIVWNTMLSLIEPFLDALTAVIDFIASVFVGDWKGAWNAIKDFFVALWNGLVNLAIGCLKGIVLIGTEMAKFFGEIADSILTAIDEWIGNVVEDIETGFQEAIDWFESLPKKAFTWGKDIIANLIEGLVGQKKLLSDAVNGIAENISDFLGFSEPKKGELSDFHTYMPDMIDLMIKGIVDGKGKVIDALKGLTGDMSLMARANIVMPYTLATATGSSSVMKNMTQNVNIQNNFNGDRAGQQSSFIAMEKAGDDAVGAMARALAYARW